MHALKGDPIYSDIRDAFNHHPADFDPEIVKTENKYNRRSQFSRLFKNYRETNSSALRQESGQKLKRFSDLLGPK